MEFVFRLIKHQLYVYKLLSFLSTFWHFSRIAGDGQEHFSALFSTGYFIKEIENTFHLLSATLQKQSWKFGRSRNSVEALALLARVPTSTFRSRKCLHVFL